MNRLEMYGLGSSGGGIYDEVELAGLNRITGSIQCQKFETAGVLKCSELITAHSLQVGGVAMIGDLIAQNVSVEGVLRSRGYLTCEKLNFEGYLSVNGDVKVGEADLIGKLKFKGGVQAETLNLMIEAKSIFTDLGATKISVTRMSDYESLIERIGKVFQREQAFMEGHLIEGEDIYLEYCRVQNVYGDHIKIGPHCIIEELEYKETLEIDPTSVVKHQKQV